MSLWEGGEGSLLDVRRCIVHRPTKLISHLESHGEPELREGVPFLVGKVGSWR